MDAIEDYIGLFRDFEVKKRKASPEGTEYLTLTLPVTLVETFQKETGETLAAAINQTSYAANINVLKGNKLRLDRSLVRSFFDNSVRSVLEHLQAFYDNQETYQIKVAILVGGVSESPILSCAINDKFSSWKVLVPHDSGLVVLKGAVLYGHDQSTIVYRMARYTYGIALTVPFIDGEHPVEHLMVDDVGERHCTHFFDIFLEEGSVIEHGQILREENSLIPIHSEDDSLSIDIYASTKKDTQFTKDESCFFLGRLVVANLDINLPCKDRIVLYTITHESTDLHIYATDKNSGRKLEASIDLLN